MKILPALACLLLALFSASIALAALAAGIFALRSQETIVAIEGLFGSLIAAILFAVIAGKLLNMGLSRLASHRKSSRDTASE